MCIYSQAPFNMPAQRIGKEKKALPLSVPIEVDANVGENWLEAH